MQPQAISKSRAFGSYFASIFSGLIIGGFIYLVIALGGMAAQSDAEVLKFGVIAITLSFLMGNLVTAFVSKLITKSKYYFKRSCIVFSILAILIFIPPIGALVVDTVNAVYNFIF